MGLGGWWLEGMCLRVGGLFGQFWWLVGGKKCGCCGFKVVFGWWAFADFGFNGRDGIPQGLKPFSVLGLRDPRLKPWGT